MKGLFLPKGEVDPFKAEKISILGIIDFPEETKDKNKSQEVLFAEEEATCVSHQPGQSEIPPRWDDIVLVTIDVRELVNIGSLPAWTVPKHEAQP